MKRFIPLLFPFFSTSYASDQAFRGDEILVAAMRFSQPDPVQPESVSILTQKDIARASSLPDLLSSLAGIRFRNTDGSTDPQIDMRGFGMSGTQNTLVLLDGQPLNEIELTAIPWSSIPLSSILRIEVIRGAGAVLYGGGATGGVIDIITKSPGTREGSVAFKTGSYGRKEADAHYDVLGEGAGLSLSADGLNTDNYRVNNAERLRNFEGDFRHSLGNGNVSLKFGADSMNLRFPGARTNLQLAADPRGTATPNDYGTRDGGHVGIAAHQEFDSGDFEGELSYRSVKRTAYFANFGGNYLDTRSRVISATPRIRIPHQFSGLNGTLVFGADLDSWHYDSSRSTAPGAALLAHVLAGQDDAALYFLDTLQIDASTSLTAGGRMQRVSLHADDSLNAAAYAHGNQVRTPRAFELGIRRAISGRLSAFARMGNSFRIATVDEIYNQYGGPVFDSIVTMLEPQTSHDREIGADWKSPGLHLHGSLYHMDLDNEIHYNALTFTNMNLSPTRRYGLELEGGWQATPELEIHGSYAYTVSEFRTGTYGGVNVAGNTIPLVPRNSASIGLSDSLPENFRVDAVVNYVGSQYFDNDQSNRFGQKMPSYTTCDVRVEKGAGAWIFSAAVDNIFDRHYFTYGVASTFTPGLYNAYPMPGRNITLGAKYRFE